MKPVRTFKLVLPMLVVLLFISGLTIAAQEQPITPELSGRIVNRIRSRSIPFFKKYRGIESIQTTMVKTSNYETGESKSTERIVIRKRNYFYENAETTTLEYAKDGEQLPVDEYKPTGNGEPGFPVFDEKGAEHYDVEVVGYRTVNGQRCYQLKVIPKENTVKHFKGHLYYSVAGLNLVLTEGTIGDLPMVVKAMNMKVFHTTLDGVAVATSVALEIKIHVPFFSPNTMLVINSDIAKHTLIPR